MINVINLEKINDDNDITIGTIKEENELIHSELTRLIIGCCFEVISEIGPGFLEKIYKNALLIAMREKGLQVDVERSYDVLFRGKVMGRYLVAPDLLRFFSTLRLNSQNRHSATIKTNANLMPQAIQTRYFG